MSDPTKATVLGISASLRNARRGLGNVSLIDDLNAIGSEDDLHDYLAQEAAIHLEHFKEAGRESELPFDQMYRNLQKLKGNKGLSNSEIALAAALWSAKEIGCEIGHLSLSEYFLETRKQRNVEELKERLLQADAIMVSTPVYFGDRGSLAQSFVNLLREDPELNAAMAGRIYGGLAVGAKRNGGQETTLIYQLLDMINTGLLGVGNDSETTSQYGGTGVAGDVGTMQKDDYGLNTAKGTGRRVARAAEMLKLGEDARLNDRHRVGFWIVQDRDGVAESLVRELAADVPGLEADILAISEGNFVRCLACDICPTHVDVDQEYRCIIKNDDLKGLHDHFIGLDAVVPVAYSPVDRKGLNSTYQRFQERTRYLRRGDYLLSDTLTAPLVIEEVGSGENMPLRMVTSMIRHHTVVSRPMHAFRHNGEILNRDAVAAEFARFNERVRRLAGARLMANAAGGEELKYNPVGYVLSAVKDAEDERLRRRRAAAEDRAARAAAEAAERLATVPASDGRA